MKRILNIMMIAILSFFSICVLIPQNSGRAAEKAVQGIQAASSKSNWEIGTVITNDDITVNVMYEDGTMKQLASTEFYIISDTKIVEGDNKITVRYIKDEKSYISNVILHGVVKSVEKIEVSLKNNKGYGIGKVITMNDITVKAYYNTEEYEEIQENCAITDSEIRNLGDNVVKISYTYAGKTVEAELVVQGLNVAVESITVNYQGNREIPINSEIDSSKIIVTGHFNNDKNQIVTGFYIMPYKIVEGEISVITVQYQNVEESFVVTGVAAVQTTLSPTAAASSPPPTMAAPTSTASGPSPIVVIPIPTASSPSSTMANPTSTVSSPSPTVPNPTLTASSPNPTVEVPTPIVSSPSSTVLNPTKTIMTPIPTLPAVVDYSMTSTLSTLKLTADKITYKIYTNKYFICKFKTSNIKKIQYQFIKKGKKVTSKWTTVSNGKLNFKKIGKYVIYIRFITVNGGEFIERTNGFIVDKTKPSISGIANSKTYKGTVKIRCKDSLSGIKTVTLNGKKIAKNYTVSRNGKYTVLAKDKANNQKKITFRISTPKPATPKPATPKPATPKPVVTAVPGVSKTVEVKSIQLSVSNLNLSIGSSKSIGLTVLPNNATNKAVTWSSTDSSVASVSSSGKVTAKKSGITIIYVVSKSNSSVTARCTVKVD